MAKSNIFQIVCEGSYTAAELVKLGDYDLHDDWITDKSFPLGRHQPVTRQIEFVELDYGPSSYGPSSKEVLREFERCGLKRPIAEDALCFGIQHKGEQRKGAVVFLHEPVLDPAGNRYVLILYDAFGTRRLCTHLFDGEWPRSSRFAGVRES